MKRSLARGLLKLLGWSVEGERPTPEKYVLIAAPHTSNWDFILMMLYAWSFDMRISWMAKHSLFRPPLGWLMRAMGGIPIHRYQQRNVVDQMVDIFAEAHQLVLVVPAEGTRGYTDYWKSGFYHIASQAGVPVVPSYLDFGRKRGGFGPAYTLSGDVRADMAFFREFYAPIQGRFPDLFGPVRLRDEQWEDPPL